MTSGLIYMQCVRLIFAKWILNWHHSCRSSWNIITTDNSIWRALIRLVFHNTWLQTTIKMLPDVRVFMRRNRRFQSPPNRWDNSFRWNSMAGRNSSFTKRIFSSETNKWNSTTKWHIISYPFNIERWHTPYRKMPELESWECFLLHRING